MDAIVQQVVEQNVIAAVQKVEADLDNELHKLENLDEEGLERVRERRMQQLKKQAAKRKQWVARGHGEYDELPSEKEFFAAMKGEERMVCHFYRENWPCKVCSPPPPPAMRRPFPSMPSRDFSVASRVILSATSQSSRGKWT